MSKIKSPIEKKQQEYEREWFAPGAHSIHGFRKHWAKKKALTKRQVRHKLKQTLSRTGEDTDILTSKVKEIRREKIKKWGAFSLKQKVESTLARRKIYTAIALEHGGRKARNRKRSSSGYDYLPFSYNYHAIDAEITKHEGTLTNAQPISHLSELQGNERLFLVHYRHKNGKLVHRVCKTDNFNKVHWIKIKNLKLTLKKIKENLLTDKEFANYMGYDPS
jgi:hypothetical protein